MSTATSKFNNPVGLAAAAPIAVALFGLLLGLGMPPVVEWFWPAPTANIAEAAALGDVARVRVLAAGGTRLDVPLPVDPRLVEGDWPATMSALEAAVRRRSDLLMQIELDVGVHPSAQEGHRLYCLALDVDAADVAALLQRALGLPPDPCQ